jgi:hypothetical protein
MPVAVLPFTEIGKAHRVSVPAEGLTDLAE